MSAANIQARIKRGLKRAVTKTGSSNSEKVYLVSVSESPNGTPINPPTQIESDIELVDAVFTEYNINSIGTSDSGGTEIKAGDRRLVSNNDIEIKQGDTIKQGSNLYFVVNVNVKAPTSDVLVYICQLRLK